MSQPITEVPMATIANNAGYPTVDTMSTHATVNVPDETAGKSNEDSGSFMLRLRGGAGCITDCLAAIGCCCVFEECCC